MSSTTRSTSRQVGVVFFALFGCYFFFAPITCASLRTFSPQDALLIIFLISVLVVSVYYKDYGCKCGLNAVPFEGTLRISTAVLFFWIAVWVDGLVVPCLSVNSISATESVCVLLGGNLVMSEGNIGFAANPFLSELPLIIFGSSKLLMQLLLSFYLVIVCTVCCRLIPRCELLAICKSSSGTSSSYSILRYEPLLSMDEEIVSHPALVTSLGSYWRGLIISGPVLVVVFSRFWSLLSFRLFMLPYCSTVL